MYTYNIRHINVESSVVLIIMKHFFRCESFLMYDDFTRQAYIWQFADVKPLRLIQF